MIANDILSWIVSNGDWLSILLITTVFSIVTIRYYTKKDQYESESNLRLLWAVILGVISVVPALILSFIALLFIPQQYSSTVVAPLVEETVKGLFVLWLARSDSFDGPLDGLVYGAMVGTGFAWVENIMYALNALDSSLGAGLFLAGIRSSVQIIAHPLYTGIFGLGVGAWSVGMSKYRIVVRWSEAVVLHAIWNNMSILGPYVLLGYLGMVIVSIIILKLELGRAKKMERRADERGYYDNKDVSYLPG